MKIDKRKVILSNLELYLNSKKYLVKEEYGSFIHSPQEVVLCLSILRTLSDLNDLNFQGLDDKQLELLFDYNQDLIDFTAYLLTLVENDFLNEILSIIEIIQDEDEDIIGTWFQRSLNPDDRKKFAVNFTKDSFKLMKSQVMRVDYDIIADPFCGSGRLITGYLTLCEIKNGIFPSKVLINDIKPTSVLVAYFRIKTRFPYVKNLIATISDGFNFTTRSDLFLINPPFTRSHLIPDPTLQILEPLTKLYSNFKTRKAGLHFWAILHLIEYLSPKSTLFAILPIMSISSTYSKILQNKLLERNFEVKCIIQKSTKSYSENSELKEFVMIIDNNKKSSEIGFIILDQIYTIINNTLISKSQLQNHWNWSIFFRNQNLLRFSFNLIRSLKLKTRKEVQITIKRGIEMYGPNFFFFPNKLYKIKRRNDKIVVFNSQVEFVFDNKKLVKILRQPRLYKRKISPTVNEFCLLISSHPDNVSKRYIEINKAMAEVAQRRFGSSWYTHINHQLRTKNPRGNLFIIDKLDLTSAGSLTLYTDKKIPCTKNFYVIQVPDDYNIKLLAAWLNSTFFLMLYLTFRREIGGTYGRLQIIDYDNLYLFLPQVYLKSKSTIKSIELAFDKFRVTEVNSISEQLDLEERLKLDLELYKYFNFQINLEEMYKICKAEINNLKLISKKS